MEYPEVKKAHIVPRCYLANFAVDGALRLNVDGKLIEHPVSIDDAAIRRTFYRRTRPDGTPIDDVEWSLSELEGAIARKLRSVRSSWPPSTIEDKGALAEFFALQFVRGPRWKAWHEEQARERIAELRRNPKPMLHPTGIWLAVTQKEINQTEDRLLSETEWLTRMMSIANLLIDVFGSMRWHLIEFREPLIAISDHPVTACGIDGESRRPEPTPAGIGALNFLEVRAPISPTLALLMTWQDHPDGPVIAGTKEIAANINAFTIASAERQWMYKPGATIPIGEGYLGPISPQLIPGYGPAEASASSIRRKVTDLIQPKLGRDLRDTVDENGHRSAEIVTAGERP
jgi:hypothetical protein